MHRSRVKVVAVGGGTGRGVRAIAADLLSNEGLVRHDPEKLARAVVETLPESLGIPPKA